MATLDRRTFLKHSGLVGGGLAAAGPLGMLGAHTAQAAQPPAAEGYGPLVEKGDLALPAAFNYVVVQTQGQPQSDGTLVPGIFDGMGAFPPAGGEAGDGKRTVLIRNHENRRQNGEIPVVVPPSARYDQDPTYRGGCTKVVVAREPAGKDPATGRQLYTYEVERSFGIIGGTDTNCAGGELPWKVWITCEEVVNRSSTGVKHGYVFEVDATLDGPVEDAVPVVQCGRMSHEAVAYSGGILYLTEDRSIVSDPVNGQIGALFYRYVPDSRPGRDGSFAETTGRLEALKVRGRPGANMDTQPVGVPLPVEWVLIEEPDHEDDTDNRRDRVPGFTPTRVQGRDKGAAIFDRLEGAWVQGRGANGGKVFFDATAGGTNNAGQIWEYDPGREVVTLLFQSPSRAILDSPDNVTIVPQTGDVLICEDGGGEQFIRGVTQDGEIFDFARKVTNDTEFCGACFSPDGQTLFVNQQGDRLGENEPPQGGRNRAVTYAIFGPFEKRVGPNDKNVGNGRSNGTEPAVRSEDVGGDA